MIHLNKLNRLNIFIYFHLKNVFNVLILCYLYLNFLSWEKNILDLAFNGEGIFSTTERNKEGRNNVWK